MSVLNANIIHPHITDRYIRDFNSFLKEQGFVECASHAHALRNLAACENHKAISDTVLSNERTALPQTAQMLLEEYLLRFKDLWKLFTRSISYRNELVIDDGRHLPLFSMTEVECRGDFKNLKMFVEEFCYHFYNIPITFVSYFEGLKLVGKKIGELLSEDDETVIVNEVGGPVGLYYFPEETNPYFNMARTDFEYGGQLYRVAKKLDILVADRNKKALEIAGLAERSTEEDEVQTNFDTMMNGEYKRTLYSIAGKDRIDTEFLNYLTLLRIAKAEKRANRWGGGFGDARVIETYLWKEINLQTNSSGTTAATFK